MPWLKRTIRRCINGFGFDVIRKKDSPFQTILGLKSFPIKTILDVGANTGQFARHILPAFPTAQYYCFEPLPGAFKALGSWSENKKNVHVFNLALGEEVGNAEMYEHITHSPSSSLLTTTQTSERLYPVVKEQKKIATQVDTLDNFISQKALTLTSDILIKLDVQGYEDRVIRGGSQTFKKARACLLEVNLQPLYRQQASFKALFRLLDDLGFEYGGNFDQTYDNNGRVVFFDAIFIRPL